MVLCYAYIAIVISFPSKSNSSFYCQLIYITNMSAKWMTVAYIFILFYNSIDGTKVARLLHKMDVYQNVSLAFATHDQQLHMKQKACAFFTSGIASLAVICHCLLIVYKKFTPYMDVIAVKADKKFPLLSGSTATVTYFVYYIEAVLHQFSAWCLILLLVCISYWILQKLHSLQRYVIAWFNLSITSSLGLIMRHYHLLYSQCQ